jgi:hypothetical protein
VLEITIELIIGLGGGSLTVQENESCT